MKYIIRISHGIVSANIYSIGMKYSSFVALYTKNIILLNLLSI